MIGVYCSVSLGDHNGTAFYSGMLVGGWRRLLLNSSRDPLSEDCLRFRVEDLPLSLFRGLVDNPEP